MTLTVMFAGAVSTSVGTERTIGAAIVMSCDTVAVFPEQSLAVQVRVNVLGQAPSLLLSEEVTAAVPQLSVAARTAAAGTAPHWTICSQHDKNGEVERMGRGKRVNWQEVIT